MARGPNSRPLKIPEGQRSEIERLAKSRTESKSLVERAQIVLYSDLGLGTVSVAKIVGCTGRTVRKWKARFRAAPRAQSLYDAPRSGRKARVPLSVRVELIKLACRRPDATLAPFREVWTHKALADALEVVTGWRLSTSEVGRILRFHQLRPHHVRIWLYSGDLNFKEKAARICELYINPPEGAHIICVDEKPMQALERLHPTVIGKNGEVRFEDGYIRNGTCCLLGAFDTQTGKVFGRVVPHRSAEETVEFMERLAQRYPDGDVYIIWDNLNTHYDGPSKRWTEFNARHGNRFHFDYTPKHASWMNQIEVWFSILQRRVLRYGSFDSTRDLAWDVHLFIQHYNEHDAHPFRWTWRTDKVQNPRMKRKEAA
jgi:transposase